jgi:cystathionine beta-synthase
MVESLDDYPKHSYNMMSEGLDKVCKWSRNTPDLCPHTQEKRDYSTKIKDSILDCIGNTPMVRLTNITKSEHIECDLLAKCEFLNPAGSCKDRIGRRMILDAEK